VEKQDKTRHGGAIRSADTRSFDRRHRRGTAPCSPALVSKSCVHSSGGRTRRPKEDPSVPNIRLQQTQAVLAVYFLAAVTPAYATFPGRNGRVALQAQAPLDAHIQIYTVRPNGRDLRQITNLTDADAVRPDWSPDGRKIAFEIDRDEAPFCSIAPMNTDGGDIVELTPVDNVCENDPHFTADGTRIVGRRNGIGTTLSYVAFQDEENFLTALNIVDIDGTSSQQLTPFTFGVAVKQDWAPNGQHLIFTKNGIGHPPGISRTSQSFGPMEATCNC
jgi:WD40-like Beta Propeller Repeat